MARAVSDGWCTFGDSELLGSPDCGRRHLLGRVASRRNLLRGPMERRQGGSRARTGLSVRVGGDNDSVTWRLGSSRAVKVDLMNL